MNGFDADWLALREPFDGAARAACSDGFGLPALAARLRGEEPMLSVLDLACGTGANLRELAPRLGGAQRWMLVDHDPLLLEALPTALTAWAAARGFGLHAAAAGLRIEGPGWQAEVQLLRLDLARDLGALPLAGCHLVTASALLDLVSAEWLDTLLAGAVAAGVAALLFALSVDGRLDCSPPLAGDRLAAVLFAAHQRRDKGFGPALGASAAAHAAGRLRALGYGVQCTASDWQLDGAPAGPARALLAALFQGHAAAAREQDPRQEPALAAWIGARLRRLPRTRLALGHLDLLATRDRTP